MLITMTKSAHACSALQLLPPANAFACVCVREKRDDAGRFAFAYERRDDASGFAFAYERREYQSMVKGAVPYMSITYFVFICY